MYKYAFLYFFGVIVNFRLYWCIFKTKTWLFYDVSVSKTDKRRIKNCRWLDWLPFVRYAPHNDCDWMFICDNDCDWMFICDSRSSTPLPTIWATSGHQQWDVRLVTRTRSAWKMSRSVFMTFKGNITQNVIVNIHDL